MSEGPLNESEDAPAEDWETNPENRFEPLNESSLAGLRCPTCRKWQTYVGRWDRDGYTWRCHGCLKAVGRCTCA